MSVRTEPPPPGRPTLVALDPALDVPVYRQIYERLRDAILTGAVPTGTRLPSWNALAAELGVARGTVKAAYDWLAGEGYVEGRGAAGTWVHRRLAGELGRRPPEPMPIPARQRAAALTALPPPLAQLQPFMMGVPALDAFPRGLWTRLLSRQARQLAPASMIYSDPAGHPPLREAIAQYLAIARGIACQPSQIFITAGYTGALALIARCLLAPGDAVWFEDPGYIRARDGLRLAGARPVPVPVDGHGLIVERGIDRAPEARLAVVTPSHHAPLGMPMTLPRRLALLDWAVRHQRYIVEDDYYGEFQFGGRPLSALKSLDGADRVLYVGTFSKVLMPALRLGYLVAPAALAGVLRELMGLLAPSPSLLNQMALADFMTQGFFARHIRRMRLLYQARRAALVAALSASFGGRTTIGLPESGMHLLLHLPPGSDDVALADAAGAAGLSPLPLTPWAIEADTGPGLILGFANVPGERAAREVARLATALSLDKRTARRGA
jgi:GntR family transcriptional regulator/MocR family aminotransferase